MLTRIVVLGTGTGVGKTWLSAALARHGDCLPLKPIETGCAPGSVPSDAAELAAAAGRSYLQPLYTFPDPVTPWLAAERSGGAIDLARIVSWVFEAEHSATTLHAMPGYLRLSLIETAGGAFSPLSEIATNVELTVALAPCLRVLVAPNRLGVLHDVTCALVALDKLECCPDYVVLSAATPPDASTNDNQRLLQQLHPATKFFSLARDDQHAVNDFHAELVTSGRARVAGL